LLGPTGVKTGAHDAFFIFMKVEDANGRGLILPTGKVGVTDKSAIGGEALCVVTIGPVADMRIMSEPPDAKVITRSLKYNFLCVNRMS
jgi:hypothetical protein